MVLILAILTSCTPRDPGHVDLPDAVPVTPTPAPTASPAPSAHVWQKISWEKYPENKPWTEYAAQIVGTELFQDLDKARDAERFCPAYAVLAKEAKINFWVELVSMMALHESAWSAVSRMQETTMGADPVTGKPVYSEGLLQLSYQDVKNMSAAKGCGIDWAKDKNLSPTDPKKTILDPIINLRCGMRILASQIARTGKIVLPSGVYWAVLKEGGKYQKIAEISGGTKKLKFCEVKK